MPMRILQVKCVIAVFALAMSNSLAGVEQDVASLHNDVTQWLEDLGNPYAARYKQGEVVYARNIWDMCAFEGKLYLGAGNSSNLGPARNAGPVPIYCYNSRTGKFSSVFEVDDEQINVFYTFHGQLYTPGHDPRESWELGNFYRLEKGRKWHKYRNIPGAIHTYAMAYFEDRLFAGLGTDNDAAVAISSDRGAKWNLTLIPVSMSRIYAFLLVKNHLYAASPIPCDDIRDQLMKKNIRVPLGIYEYDGAKSFFKRNDIKPQVLFPGVSLLKDINAKVVCPLSFNGKAVYIGAYCHNDHQFNPFGVFVASSFRKGAIHVRRVNIPERSRCWDLLTHNGAVYLLQDLPQKQETIIRVLKSKDLENWIEMLRFQSKTFARSFAVLDGSFYFALGCEIKDPANWKLEELDSKTGTIMRVKEKYFRLLDREQNQK